MANEEVESEFQAKLEKVLVDAFDSVREERQTHWSKPDVKRPQPAGVPGLIRGYSTVNAGVAGALNLVPGPWGLVAIVPELGIVIRNQIQLVYDIGVAHGKEKFLTTELLLGIVTASLGGGGLGLIVIKGQQVLVKRASLRVIQKVIAWLGGKITQRVIKQFLVRFLPGAGAAAMAAWAYYSTRAVGRKAAEILSSELVFEGEADEVFTAEERGVPYEASDEEFAADLVRRKVTTFINLMNADSVRRPAEIDYVHWFITSAELDRDADEKLRRRVALKRRMPVDLAPFADRVDEGATLMLELAALALRDGELHHAEVEYIKSVGAEIGFEESEVQEILDDAVSAEVARSEAVADE